jgi:hypothetical protein
MSMSLGQQVQLEGEVVLTVVLQEKGGGTFDGHVVKLSTSLNGADHVLIVDIRGLQDVPDHWQIIFLDGSQVSYLRQRNAGDVDDWGAYDVKFTTGYGTP